MRKVIVLLGSLIFLFSCSHAPAKKSFSITSATSGMMKNYTIPFPVYLTNTLESRESLEKKYSDDLFIIHTGHILKPKLSKAENEKTLENLSKLGINLVNLTLEDFVVAEVQNINFESYNQRFLNSSVIDLNLDTLDSAKNIMPYYVHNGIAFIGLSDAKLDNSLPKEKFIISDYVLSILKVKKTALSSSNSKEIKSFIIIHTLDDNEINDVMGRLPPSFINSLAD